MHHSRPLLQWELPRVLASLTDKFSLSRTKFNNDKDKAGTGRRVLGTVLGKSRFELLCTTVHTRARLSTFSFTFFAYISFASDTQVPRHTSIPWRRRSMDTAIVRRGF
jgi:hypothetical protein